MNHHKILDQLSLLQIKIEAVAKKLDQNSDGYKYLMDACDAIMDAQQAIDMEATDAEESAKEAV